MEIRKPATNRSSGGTRKKPVSKIAQKRVKKKKARGIFLAVMVIVLLVLSVLILRSEKFFIKKVTVSGAITEYNKSLEKQINEYLEGSIILFLPKKNIILFPEEKLTEKLLVTNSYLENITFKREGVDRLNVEVKERAPYFSINSNMESNLFIDGFGVVYSDPQARISTSTLPIQETASSYGASTTGALPVDLVNLKGKPLPENYFNGLTRSIDLFRAKNFTIYSITLRPHGDADIQITPEGGLIRVNLYDDIDKTVATFSAARKIEPLRTKLNEQRSYLRYIDLRFGNKVFYTFNTTP